jgi:FkbM family methyltransferase
VFFKKSKIENPWVKKSYSQSGEDLIIKFLFQILGIAKPSYIDIGAHHPFYLSNTALFYEAGSTGVNIEPDPGLISEFIKNRSHDINLNIGIGKKEGNADFYIISTPTLNTFSKTEAENYKKEGDYHIKEVINVPINTLHNVIEKHCGGKFPDLLSVDAEGVDEIIIKSIDYENNYPIIICVETLTFSETRNGKKNQELIDYITKNGYLIYADTNINTIFIKEEYWRNKTS